MGNEIEKINKSLKNKQTFTEYLRGFNLAITKELSDKFKNEKKIYELKCNQKPTTKEDLYSLLITYKIILEKTHGHIKLDNKIWKEMFNYKKKYLKKMFKINEVLDSIHYNQIDEFKIYFYHYIKNEMPKKIIEIQQKKKEEKNKNIKKESII